MDGDGEVSVVGEVKVIDDIVVKVVVCFFYFFD